MIYNSETYPYIARNGGEGLRGEEGACEGRRGVFGRREGVRMGERV